MATGTAVAIFHGTLVAATVDTITLSGGNFRGIEIVNRGSGDIFVTTDGTTAPTSGGAETQVIPANTAAVVANASNSEVNVINFNVPGADHTHGDTVAGSTVVKLISSGTPAYTVSGKPVPRYVG